MVKVSLDGLRATYTGEGAKAHVVVSVGGLEIVTTTGKVFIERWRWEATKELVDGALAHYYAMDKAMDKNQEEERQREEYQQEQEATYG